jgi:hypothetical protein
LSDGEQPGWGLVLRTQSFNSPYESLNSGPFKYVIAFGQGSVTVPWAFRVTDAGMLLRLDGWYLMGFENEARKRAGLWEWAPTAWVAASGSTGIE